MTSSEIHYFSFEEVCDVAELSSTIVIKAVEHGIIDPAGSDPASWMFDTQMIVLTKKAYRLHIDLGIEWTGIALAIHLLQEVEQLRIENEKLRQRLGRFFSA